MPSKTVELAVLDTSVYIENFRTGRFTQKIIESPFLFRGISTVIHELLRGARRVEEREFALALVANLRLYTPTTPEQS
jgi:predicted nucleic acid-binding protein